MENLSNQNSDLESTKLKTPTNEASSSEGNSILKKSWKFIAELDQSKYAEYRITEGLNFLTITETTSNNEPKLYSIAFLDKQPLFKVSLDSKGYDLTGLPYKGGKYYGELSQKALPHGMGLLVKKSGNNGKVKTKEGSVKWKSFVFGEFVDGSIPVKPNIIIKHGESITRIVGDFKDNSINGSGYIEFSNGDKYEGSFRKNMMHGEGQYQSRNGLVYRGSFIDNRRVGKGKINTSSTRESEDLSLAISGVWENNSLIALKSPKLSQFK